MIYTVTTKNHVSGANMAAKSHWTTAEIDPRTIQLDLLNPRVELNSDADQAEIRLKLLKLEDVLELARGIAKNGGLFPGERVITVEQDGKHIVLEGNRRIAACQMLLRPSWVPGEYADRFPVASAALKAALRSISVDVAPTREAADPILQKRHTEQGAKPWSPVAKMRRAVRMLERASIEDVATALGTTPSAIRKLVKPYRLLQYALNLGVWTADELEVLENEKLVTNPYTRFFTLKDTLRILRLSFDADQNPVSELPPEVFREQMIAIARDFLLPDPVRGRPRYDTRTQPLAYFERFLKTPAGKAAMNVPAAPKGAAAPADAPAAPPTTNTPNAQPTPPVAPSPTPAAGAARPKTPKASVFFENLECHVLDDNLIKLTQEIKRIDHAKLPIAASLMMRALFECALVFKIKQAKKWSELIKQAPKPGWDPGLGDLINFAKNFNNGVFTENNICKVLGSHHTQQAKSYLDAMTHIKYQGIDVNALETYANHLRGTIKYILEGN
ncbi:ParB/Srx family N-terminal domain-containing protein [Burkholderia vietnamiensis]|uniref:ParB/Srx family N-terminal domain-containing protein n=1 Tax=Burkholderia vietnamiensis TaxID=60552 RepID=UPI0030C89E6A